MTNTVSKIVKLKISRSLTAQSKIAHDTGVFGESFCECGCEEQFTVSEIIEYRSDANGADDLGFPRIRENCLD